MKKIYTTALVLIITFSLSTATQAASMDFFKAASSMVVKLKKDKKNKRGGRKVSSFNLKSILSIFTKKVVCPAYQ